MRPLQTVSADIDDDVWLITWVWQSSSWLPLCGGTLASTSAWVMQIWVVIGAMPGMLMPRCCIIAMASGGICGMLAIFMLVVMVHSPALPCPARATPGDTSSSATEAIK